MCGPVLLLKVGQTFLSAIPVVHPTPSGLPLLPSQNSPCCPRTFIIESFDAPYSITGEMNKVESLIRGPTNPLDKACESARERQANHGAHPMPGMQNSGLSQGELLSKVWASHIPESGGCVLGGAAGYCHCGDPDDSGPGRLVGKTGYVSPSTSGSHRHNQPT